MKDATPFRRFSVCVAYWTMCPSGDPRTIRVNGLLSKIDLRLSVLPGIAITRSHLGPQRARRTSQDSDECGVSIHHLLCRARYGLGVLDTLDQLFWEILHVGGDD